MANLLVTGGAGFIGSNFVFYHHTHYPQDNIIILDFLTYAGFRKTLEPVLSPIESFDLNKGGQCALVVGNIQDKDLVYHLLHTYNISKVVNFAAESHVDRSIDAPDTFIETNICGTYNLLKAIYKYAQEQHEIRCHHISTDEVYGALTLDEPSFSENSPFRPNSPYSASKAASDCIVRSFVKTYGLTITTSNCSNNYGARQFPEKLIPKTIIGFLKGKKAEVYGSGMQVRDWIEVDDHCHAIELCLERGKAGETYNIGANCELSNLQMIQLIAQAIFELFCEKPQYLELYPNCIFKEQLVQSNKEATLPHAKQFTWSEQYIEHVADRLGHDFRYSISYNKAQEQINYQPKYTKANFYVGLKNTVQWYLDHQDWWALLLERCAQRHNHLMV